MIMAYEQHGNMEEKICNFLKDKKEGAVALVIAKGVGLKTTKDVNPVLYKLERDGQLFCSPDQPPVWSLLKLSGVAVSRQVPAQPDPLEQEVRRLLTCGSIGMSALQITKNVGKPRNVVKKCLYNLRSKGGVEKSVDGVWAVSDGTSEGQLITYRCNGEEQDNCIRLTTNSRFSQEFELVSVLGAGGFGCVTKAKHKIDGKNYAVKIVEYTEKSDREVKALALLKHPNIVQYNTTWKENAYWMKDDGYSSSMSSELSDSDQEDSSGTANGEGVEASSNSQRSFSGKNMPCLFIQMEFCEEGTLKEWIAGDKKEGAHQIFQQIVCGVQYIHSENLMHRDLKPENVFIGRDGTIKIGDFGLVTMIKAKEGSVKRTKDKGTPIYMSPEQRVKEFYDEKTDIFSLGLIWFELLWKMSTYAEKDKVFRDLQKQVFPEGFDKKFMNEHKLMRRMFSERPTDRPGMEEIADFIGMFLRKNSRKLQQNTV